MATHVGIIHKGRLLFQGTLTELQSMKNKQSFLQMDTSDNAAALKLLADYGAEMKNGYVVMPFKEKTTTAAINRELVKRNIDVYVLQPQQNDLEQLFIDITSNHN